MLQYINHRLRVTTTDGRCLVGNFLAFDRHMNLVLAQTEEFRLLKGKNKPKDELADVEEKRALGLVLLRGENVVSLQVESPPQKEKVKLPETATPGVSVAMGAATTTQTGAPMGLGRGMNLPPPGVPPPGINMFQ